MELSRIFYICIVPQVWGKIMGSISIKENLNQYDVIKINMQEFLSMSDTIVKKISAIQRISFFAFQSGRLGKKMRNS